MSDLKPGEVRLVGPNVAGHQMYELRHENGELERGTAGPMDCECTGDGYVELGERVRPGVRKLASYTRFTARGPSAVVSNAYRSGWDAVFGKNRVSTLN